MKKRLISIIEIDNVRVFLIMVLGAIFAHLDRLVLGVYALYKIHDQFDSFWPFQVAMAERLLSFNLPLWFPDYLGGLPFLYMDINWLSPYVWLSGMFPDPLSSMLVTMMQFVLAGFGTYLFFTYFFKSRRLIAIIAGLMWAFGVFELTYWRIFDLAALPMLLYCTDAIVFSSDRKQKIWLLTGLFLAASNIYLAKGAPFIAIFQFFFIFSCHNTWRDRIKTFSVFGFLWFFVLMLNMPVIVSLFSSVEVGSRGLVNWIRPNPLHFTAYLREIFFAPMAQSAMTFGVTGTVMLFFALINFKKWNDLSRKLFFFYAIVMFFVIFIDTSIWFQSMRQHLPLKDFRLSRLALVAPFILFIIATTNIEKFVEFCQKSIRRLFLFLIISGSILIFYNLTKHIYIEKYVHLLSILIFVVFFALGIIFLKKIGLRTRWVLILLMILLICERFVDVNISRITDGPSFNNFFVSEVFKEYKPNKKYDYRIAFLNYHPTIGIFNGYQVAGGYASQYLKRYAIFWKSVLVGNEENEEFNSYPYKAYLIDNNFGYYKAIDSTIENLSFRPSLLALHNVKYVFSLAKINDPERCGLSIVHNRSNYYPVAEYSGLYYKVQKGVRWLFRMFTSQDYYVYRIDKCLPRVFAVNKFTALDNEKLLEKHLNEVRLMELRDRVFLNAMDLSQTDFEQLSFINSNKSCKTLLKIEEYSDNRIVVKAKADDRCILVLSDNYAPEWVATNNGKPVTILPAYGVFRSVILKKGENTIVFEYRPTVLIYSYYVSGFGIIVLMLGAFILANITGDKTIFGG
ncbi:MAG: DUF6044 family protein [Candidatus Margulisiibacteriota bacterium]